MFKENAKKVETIIKTSEEPQSSRLNGFQRLKECCFIVGVLSSVLLAVALFTFSPADPSWSQTAWGGEIDNAGGLFGAWLADTLFFTFGSLAYPIPFLLAAAAWVICRKRGEDEPIDFMLWGTRLLGLTVLIMTSCGLADINFDDIWYFSSGGVVGDVLSSLALPTLNVLGTTLVLLFLWGAGFTLFTGISWLNIVEWLGDRSLAVLAAIANKFRGSEQETLEPQLDEFVEDKVSTKHVEDDQQDDETLPHLTAYEVEEPKEKAAVHEYPIYMPQAKSETSAVKPTPEPQPQRVAAVNATPTYVEPEPQLKAVSTDNVDPMVERTKQLNVTIEELEAAAQQADDWASEEQTSQSYADTNAVYQEQVQAKHEEVVEHDTPQLESSYAEYAQFAAQQEQQLHVEPTPHEELLLTLVRLMT
ncbi:DNA translocase FtsK, partial [Vibrio parahaemolyticus K5030]